MPKVKSLPKGPRTFRFPDKVIAYIERRWKRKGYGSIQDVVIECLLDAQKHDEAEREVAGARR